LCGGSKGTNRHMVQRAFSIFLPFVSFLIASHHSEHTYGA
jgi:hypothetical protein